MLNKNFVKIAIAVLIVVILYNLFVKPKKPEQFEPIDPDFIQQATVPPSSGATTSPQKEKAPQITMSPDNVTMPPLTTSVDLLPKPNTSGASEFGEFAPVKALEAQNFVDATKMVGVDTVGSSLRNASYDLRRSPPIPRQNVGPWQQSTIEADLYRKSLDC